MAAVVDKEKCSGCEACIDICPVEAISMKNGTAFISDDCTECEACVGECPSQAISV